MRFVLLPYILLGCLLCPKINGQQFDGTLVGLDYPGVSENCVDALNTTVANCPGFLVRISINNPRLHQEQLDALCTTSCRTGLSNVRQVIAASCGQVTDTIQVDGVVWPGPYRPT